MLHSLLIPRPNFRSRQPWFLLLAACAASVGTLDAQLVPTLGPAPRVINRTVKIQSDTQPSAAYGDSSYGLTVDPSKREQSRVFYRTVYPASSNASSGWKGSVLLNNPGTTTQAFKDAIVLRINYFRAMSGMPAAITFKDLYSGKDQQAALMMSANAQLSHFPPLTWLDYTVDGAAAASSSNLALGMSGPDAVDGYIEDGGDNNSEVGHRRWILFPPTRFMGTGDVDFVLGAGGAASFYPANAIWVLDPDQLPTRPDTRETFVSWPPAGYVPYPLIFDRWSLAYPNADFSTASVTMTSRGTTYPVALEPAGTGYGENTLVWRPQNLDLSAYSSAVGVSAAQEQPIHVAVSGVKVGGQTMSFAYDVTPIDAQKAGPDTVYPVLSGTSQPATGSPNAYTFAAVPNATSYLWEADTLSPLTLVANAESGTGDVSLNPPTASVISTTIFATGAASYQLASYPPLSMMLNTTFVPAAGSTLQFSSRLTWATTDDTAEVQISSDLGQSWKGLYKQIGTGTMGESAFTPKTIDLSAYTGQSCRIRFVFYSAGSFFSPAPNVGWFVDDITVTGAQKMTLGTQTSLSADSTGFNFAPAGAGSYALRVRPVFYGSYPATDLDSVEFVTAGGTTTPSSATFFAGETALGSGVYYLSFPGGNPFGYYSYLTDPKYVYHFDLGYEYVFDAADGKGGAYFYDFSSGGFFYTSPNFPFPYMYDFSLNSTVYYYPDPTQPGHYNTDGMRYFFVFNTGQIISK